MVTLAVTTVETTGGTMLNARELDRLVALRNEAYREIQEANREKQVAELRLRQAQERFLRICQGDTTATELSHHA